MELLLVLVVVALIAILCVFAKPFVVLLGIGVAYLLAGGK